MIGRSSPLSNEIKSGPGLIAASVANQVCLYRLKALIAFSSGGKIE